MNKAQFKRVLRDTHDSVYARTPDAGPVLTREQKWQVLWAVADNLLKEHRITAQQHKQWTEAY